MVEKSFICATHNPKNRSRISKTNTPVFVVYLALFTLVKLLTGPGPNIIVFIGV